MSLSFSVTRLLMLLLMFAAPAASAEFEIISGSPIQISAPGAGTMIQVARPGELYVPRDLFAAAEPAASYRSELSHRLEMRNELSRIAQAIVYGLNIEFRDSRFDPEQFLDPPERPATLSDVPTLPTAIRTLLLDPQASLFALDVPNLAPHHLQEIRYLVPPAAALDDSALSLLVSNTQDHMKEMDQENILLEPTGLISVAPSRPNGGDGRFYIVAPAVSINEVGEYRFSYSAEEVCRPLRRYWTRLLQEDPIRPESTKMLANAGLPTDINTAIAKLDSDCTELQVQIDDYNQYLRIVSRLDGVVENHMPDGAFVNSEQLVEQITASIAFLNEEKVSASGVDIGQIQKNSVGWFIRYLVSEEIRRRRASDREASYWGAYRNARDVIRDFEVQSRITRYWIESERFAVKPGMPTAAFIGYFSDGDTSSLRRLGRNPYLRPIVAAEQSLFASIVGAGRPSMLGVGDQWVYDASFSDTIIYFNSLKAHFDAQVQLIVLDLKARYRETLEAFMALGSFYHLGEDEYSSLWVPEPAIAIQSFVSSGQVVTPGVSVVLLEATQRRVALGRFPRSEWRHIIPGRTSQYTLEGEGSVLGGNNGDLLLPSCAINQDDPASALRNIAQTAMERVFNIQVIESLGIDEHNSIMALVEIWPDDNSPIAVEEGEQLISAECAGLPVVTVGGRRGVRLDLGLLAVGSFYQGVPLSNSAIGRNVQSDPLIFLEAIE